VDTREGNRERFPQIADRDGYALMVARIQE
jgi:hypothetical protein